MSRVPVVRTVCIFFFTLICILILTFPSGAALPTPASTGESGIYAIPLRGRYALSAALGREQESYHMDSQGKDLRAANRSQSFTARFSPEGLIVETLIGSFAMSLSSSGYGTCRVPVQPANPQACANRVEYRRGSLSEWYVNGPFGLQQGFTLDAPPA